MPPEHWLVVTIAAAFLLLGIAGSPLAWALLFHRRSRFEQQMEGIWRKLADELRAVDDRVSQFQAIHPAHSRPPQLDRSDTARGRGTVRAEDTIGSTQGGGANSVRMTASGGCGSVRADLSHESPLIAIPSLEGATGDRDVTVHGLMERYAAIWALADTGSTADVIARATGQPVGQIELILGLRRRIDGTKWISSHSPHG